MKTAPHYPIRLHWSEEDGEWVATSPAWPALSALAESPQQAAKDLQQAIRLASEVNAGLGRPVPEALTIADLKRAGSLLKIAALATLAGLPAQTLHSKIRRDGGLTPEEAAAIHNALAGVNLAMAK